jgi:hypothetical protein
VAYQWTSECFVTVMCCSVTWLLRISRRSFACCGHGELMRTQPYFASRTRPASRESPSRTVNRFRSRCLDLNRGNRRWPERNAAWAFAASRSAYRNVHVECSPAHDATSGFSAVHILARVKKLNGRTRSAFCMPQVASAAHWSALALIFSTAQFHAFRRAPAARSSIPG